MKYMILIHGNQIAWDDLPEAQRMEFARAHLALTEELAASGELIVSEGLADPSLARRVSVRGGRITATDGPFAEVKEQLAGFYLVECESVVQAVEIAARVPDAAYGAVEVRPILDMSLLDL